MKNYQYEDYEHGACMVRRAKHALATHLVHVPGAVQSS